MGRNKGEKMIKEMFDVDKWKKEHPDRNPNLNQVLNLNRRLFENAFVSLDGLHNNVIVVNCEPYSAYTEPKNKAEWGCLYHMIKEQELELFEIFPKARYVEINMYK